MNKIKVAAKPGKLVKYAYVVFGVLFVVASGMYFHNVYGTDDDVKNVGKSYILAADTTNHDTATNK